MTNLTNFDLCNLKPFVNANKYYYSNVTLNNSEYNINCFRKIGKGLDDSTEYVYNEEASIIAGIGATVQGITGFTLNLLIVIVLLKNSNLRKEWLTPYILSLAAADILYSGVLLPILAIKYFARSVTIQLISQIDKLVLHKK